MGTESKKLAAQTARLAAVQTVYQTILNPQPMAESLKVYMEHYAEMEIDGARIAAPDKALFGAIARGIEARFSDVQSLVDTHYHRNNDKEMEPLLRSILLCGTYEILAHEDIDSPIIINDYLNIAHEFYEKGEVSLINAVLDAVFATLRDKSASAS